MRDATTRSAAQGVGSNPVFLWGGFTLKNAAEPVLVHGAGLSVKRTAAGKWTITLDGGVRPRVFTPFVQAHGAAGPIALFVKSWNETTGAIYVEGDDTLNDVPVSVAILGAGP